MQIVKDTVVTLKYTVQDSQGESLEIDGEELTYLHGGYGGMLDRVEMGLEGKTAGAELKLYLEPDDAFGEYEADLLRVEPRELFPETLDVGMQFEGIPGDNVPEDDDDAGLIFRVTDITSDSVVLDGNHPLAGMSLRFIANVVSVRAATQDEVANGHASEDLGVVFASAARTNTLH
jgi:FKBP-type peptidyl-prolyl cis-trans isomerase SlyD